MYDYMEANYGEMQEFLKDLAIDEINWLFTEALEENLTKGGATC